MFAQGVKGANMELIKVYFYGSVDNKIMKTSQKARSGWFD